MSYQIAVDQPVEVIQKTYYFPGWELMVDEQARQINYQDPEFPGHIVYSLKPGRHRMKLQFTDHTSSRFYGWILSAIGVAGALIYVGGWNKIKHFLHQV